MFQDPTAVAISGGTGIVGFRVDGPFAGGGPPPGYAPTVTTDPVLVQYPIVGTAQAYTSGSASGNPTPTLTIQWMLDGVAIPGETAATYTPVIGDIGGLLSVQETWTNAFGTASAESPSWLVTPAMAAAASHKYIDPTLAGGTKSSGDDYTPPVDYLLADGSAAPAGKIYATCKLAYDAASGNGHRYYCRKGYFHDPTSGVFFVDHFTRSDTLFSSYGPADAEMPVLDSVVYLDDATGWTPHGSVSGAWNYSLTGITANNAAQKGRLWVGRRNDGDETSQRPIGTARRRAANSVNNVSLSNGSENAGLWYITAGSPSTLTVMASVAEAPPVYWDGLGLVFDDHASATERGISFRNGASNNRVEGIVVQGASFKAFAIATMTSNSTCDSNAFVNVVARSFCQDGLDVAGANASRTIENTYVSGLSLLPDSSVFECDSGTTNDFSNANPISIGGFTSETYLNNISYEGFNVHTIFDTVLTSNEPPVNVYVDGVDVTFLPGSNDGRAWGGFVDGGYFRNFTITGSPARSQWGGIDFEVAYGTFINSTNTNKDPDNQYQAIKMTLAGDPSGTTTANFSIHDVTFNLVNDPLAKCAVWFEGFDGAALSAAEEPDANAVAIYDCRAILSNTQGLIVNGTQGSKPDPWPDQNIHDNVVVNAALVGQNYSTTNGGAIPPTYTTRALNGYFGCADNTISTV